MRSAPRGPRRGSAAGCGSASPAASRRPSSPGALARTGRRRRALPVVVQRHAPAGGRFDARRRARGAGPAVDRAVPGGRGRRDRRPLPLGARAAAGQARRRRGGGLARDELRGAGRAHRAGSRRRDDRRRARRQHRARLDHVHPRQGSRRRVRRRQRRRDPRGDPLPGLRARARRRGRRGDGARRGPGAEGADRHAGRGRGDGPQHRAAAARVDPGPGLSRLAMVHASEREQQVLAATPRRLHIDGIWRDGERGATLPVEDPATGAVLCEVADATPADALAALDAAAFAFPSFSTTAPRERAEILRRAYEMVLAQEKRLALLMTLEMGKPLAEASGEVRYAAAYLRWYAEEAVRIGGRFGPAEDGGSRVLTLQQPVGPCVFVTPWNFPLAMGARKV